MFDGLHVHNEIGPLRKVMLHRPGDELLNLVPRDLDRLLFDDIPFLEVAQKEHDLFADMLRAEGVEVLYLEKLLAEALDSAKREIETLKRDVAMKKKMLASAAAVLLALFS